MNSEKENYQEGNLEVRDGNLVITARRERVDKQDYTSGRINTAVRPGLPLWRIAGT